MRDIDPISTGPDHYFDKALHYPEFMPKSLSTRKILFHPSESSFQNSNIESLIGYRISAVDDKRDSAVHFYSHYNGIKDTSKYSTDTDLDSQCGSLAYSVESWGMGQCVDDEYRQDSNVEVEIDLLLTMTAREEHQYQHEIFDPCFRPLSWAVSLLQESFKKISFFPDEMQNESDYVQQR
eukprot:jgi/Psemu1/1971/gm1.1971_g